MSTPQYGDTIMPLVEGGSLFLWIGSDSVAIILSYCEKEVVHFIDLHRPFELNSLLVDQLTADFERARASITVESASGGAGSSAPLFVTRLCSHLTGLSLVAESASAVAPAAAQSATAPSGVWHSLSHAKRWYQQMAAQIAAHERRLHDLQSRERFRCAARGYFSGKTDVDATAASALVPSKAPDDTVADSFAASMETARVVARSIPAPAIAFDAGVYTALHGVDIQVEDSIKGRGWQRISTIGYGLWNELRLALRFGGGLAPVCVDVFCTGEVTDTDERLRHSYQFTIRAMPHDTRATTSGSGGSGGFDDDMRFLFRCTTIGDYAGPERFTIADPTDTQDWSAPQRDCSWTHYRTHDRSGLRIDDWKRGGLIPTVVRFQRTNVFGTIDDIKETLPWKDVSAPPPSPSPPPSAVSLAASSKSESDAAASAYAKLDADQWVSVMLLAAASASHPCPEWRAAFRALANHKRKWTFDDMEARV